METKNNKMLGWDEFMNVEMRIGTIISAEIFKEAKNPAYVMKIDFGEYGIRKTSAQITKLYSIDVLIGKQVVAVINFPPKQIATIMSECLVLGGIGDEKEITLLQPERPIKNGSRIG